ncbi:hypothetical protein GQ55_9G463600 [Panicum hallii var. hallii]|uniref:Uncharacterized protein n=1 Tax=Panicum hallii var. hallii TaxID=1504633 RepID=A0A2T7CC74_9POAL|nr:hypothetical protein GQ55_9G463600 [Panicum hallii var. hallii]
MQKVPDVNTRARSTTAHILPAFRFCVLGVILDWQSVHIIWYDIGDRQVLQGS